ncbi:MAG: DUF255 domain-containing protein [Candidatus Binatia bacterium]
MHRFSPNSNLAHLIPWFEWENEAFAKARADNKPVMLFLAAFWCRYCQRMDEQAFSDRENLALLNAYFVALRVEDAKRPDIDARYNLNGWPTVAFFTPAGELLAAANYLPTEQFKELLLNVYIGYQEKNDGDLSENVTEDNETVAAIQIKPETPTVAALSEIARSIISLADRQNGGYGRGQKFIHPDANDFLISCYESTKDATYLDHVRLTLDRMRHGPIYDAKDGGYFRTTTGADWTQPHREKLLAEHAGLLNNCLRVFRLTQRPEYARLAEEIIGYLDKKLFDPSKPAFFGCEDFLRFENETESKTEEFFTIIDDCIYTDANALAVIAYLNAAGLLKNSAFQTRALAVLDFLWSRCKSEPGCVCHFYDGAAREPGHLRDQTQVGCALIEAYHRTGDGEFIERAKELAEFIVLRLTNPRGGYYDRATRDAGILRSRLTLIEQNGVAAAFFLRLAGATNLVKYRDAARWALSAFTADFAAHGIHAARFGQALGEFMNGP